MRKMDIVIIGLGGVGSTLTRQLCRFINFSHDINSKMTLVDGDAYELKNYERQEFLSMGNKADIQCQELRTKFSNIMFSPYSSYINEGNIKDVIKEDDVVFLCVDNHKSRMIINNYCKLLNNITLISGGNELTDGNAQLFVKRDGKELTPDLCAFHPEIANPDDKLPDEMSCEELANSQPQLYFTNVCVSIYMCLLFYNSMIHNKYDRSEVYFDIQKMVADSKIRIVK